jgi:hypothetical protein
VLASIVVNVLLSAMKDLSDFQFFPGEDDDFEDKELSFLLFFDARRKLDDEGRRSMEREEEGEDDANNVDDGAFNMLVVVISRAS